MEKVIVVDLIHFLILRTDAKIILEFKALFCSFQSTKSKARPNHILHELGHSMYKIDEVICIKVQHWKYYIVFVFTFCIFKKYSKSQGEISY